MKKVFEKVTTNLHIPEKSFSQSDRFTLIFYVACIVWPGAML
ncbi:hypothetical protein [Nostoc sp.]